MADFGCGRDDGSRELFLALLGELERVEARYVFVRNYEGYPDHFTGDVDVYLDLDRVRAGLTELVRTCEGAGWSLLRKVVRPWVIVLQFVRGEGIGRSVMVFELFAHFSWLQYPYASFDSLWERRLRDRGVPALPDDLGVLVTVGHYLFWAGFLPQKYQAAVRAAIAESDFSTTCHEAFGWPVGGLVERWLHRYARIEDGAWERMDNVPEPLYRAPWWLRRGAQSAVVARLLFRSPIVSLRAATATVLIKLREFVSVTGTVLLVPGHGWDFLEQVKRFHLYKNRHTILLGRRDFSGPRTFAALVRAYWSISRGGLCIVDRSQVDESVVEWLSRLFGPRIRSVPDSPASDFDLIDLVIAAVR